VSSSFAALAAAAQVQLAHRFDFGNEAGTGGQGIVIRARRRMLDDGTTTSDDVAVKFHHDPAQDARITREISVMTRLRHACLANLLEHGTVDVNGVQVRFIVSEFIEGESLSHIIACGPVAAETVAVVGRDIATAIREIWSQHVVHRDVKPANIMLRAGHESAVLIDLGCARHLEHSTLTGAGFRVGTDGYMSPEQGMGEHQLTCFSDMFSLGLTLTEALTGRHPTSHRQNIIHQVRITPSTLATTAPVGLVQLLDRMLQPRPAFRPRPDELADALDRLVQQLHPPTP
jgi:eukaryotic-like serine/threonine-protein kinase